MALVSGTVTDLEKKPISGVLVSLNQFWTVTETDGTYILEVPEEAYTLKAVMRGYRTVEERVRITGDTTADITMVPLK